jgi:hypothetical protein
VDQKLDFIENGWEDWKHKYFQMKNSYGNGLMTFSEMDYDSGRWYSKDEPLPCSIDYRFSKEILKSIARNHDFEKNCLFSIIIYDEILQTNISKRRNILIDKPPTNNKRKIEIVE